MKTIKNTSLQGLSVTLIDPSGGDKSVKSVYLLPGKKVTVPDKWEGNVLKNLISRRMVKVSVTPDAAPVKAPIPPKPNLKVKKNPLIRGK